MIKNAKRSLFILVAAVAGISLSSGLQAQASACALMQKREELDSFKK